MMMVITSDAETTVSCQHVSHALQPACTNNPMNSHVTSLATAILTVKEPCPITLKHLTNIRQRSVVPRSE